MSNTFGRIFKITTFGESHGSMIGVVVDGCPAGLSLCEKELDQELQLKIKNTAELVSARVEPNCAKIVSGVFEGKTTGTPIAILIENKDADSSKYEPIKDLLRPSHANFTYLEKYGIFDYRGGGRASARETNVRIAAGVIAKKILQRKSIKIKTSIRNIEIIRQKISESAGDSIGGIVDFVIENVPVGLGEPIYDKLDARLASAMLGIPAVKGFEIGDGFAAASLSGSENNDLFVKDKAGKILSKTNHAGGVLGGISNGMPIVGAVAFKPTPSIMKEQPTIDIKTGKEEILKLPEGSRHDACVAIRGAKVVDAMAAIVMADFLLLQKAC